MIVHEATPDDLRPLLALSKKVWTQLGIPFNTSLSRFRKLSDGGARIVVLYDSADLVASLTAYRLETDRGPAFEIVAFIVDQDRPDKITLLDALSLYALNIGVSDGCRVVISRPPTHLHTARYGPVMLGMNPQERGRNVNTGEPVQRHQTGDPRAMMTRILERHPEWLRSL